MALDEEETQTGQTVSASAVERTYEAIHEMALSFRLRPGERLNESELSRELGISRTPLREALNRLVAENLLEFVPSKGFFRRSIQPREIFELYQLRLSLETLAAELLIQRLPQAAPDSGQNGGQNGGLQAGLQAGLGAARAMAHAMATADTDQPGTTLRQTVQDDEAFHEALAGLSGNGQLLDHLRAINLRIRPVRHFGMSRNQIRDGGQVHLRILDAIEARDRTEALRLLASHITCRLDEVESDVRQLYGQIYVG